MSEGAGRDRRHPWAGGEVSPCCGVQLRADLSVNEDGTRENVTERIQLSVVEQREWDRRVGIARAAEMATIREALNDLADEVAVLRMISVSLAGPAAAVRRLADQVPDVLGDAADTESTIGSLEIAVDRLWSVANGEPWSPWSGAP